MSWICKFNIKSAQYLVSNINISVGVLKGASQLSFKRTCQGERSCMTAQLVPRGPTSLWCQGHTSPRWPHPMAECNGAGPSCLAQAFSNRQPLSSGTPVVYIYPVLPSLSLFTGVRPTLWSEGSPCHLLPPPPFFFTDIASNKSLVCSSSSWHLLPRGSTLTLISNLNSFHPL